MEYVNCDLCGKDDARFVYHVMDTNYGTPGEFSIVQCQQCKLVYLNPRPSLSEYPRIYPDLSYDPFVTSQTSAKVAPNQTLWQRGRQLTGLDPVGRVLDVGCADGSFLKVMSELGWSCVGIEPNPRASNFAREQLGLDVRQGNIFDVSDSEKFSLITFWDVLEHVPSPQAALVHAHKLLQPTGHLVLSLPNWHSFERYLFRQQWISIDAPRHFYHFSPITIRALLANCGFEIEQSNAQAPVMSLASNLLRQGGNWCLRGGSNKTAHELNAPTRRVLSRKRQMLMRLVYLGMFPCTVLINLLNRGSGLFIIARRVEAI
jgi:2-polyprenyl-3-methyl-5-hydroxy-6-metoxy-1,4-benzoquinol methylase